METTLNVLFYICIYVVCFSVFGFVFLVYCSISFVFLLYFFRTLASDHIDFFT